jgi:hypothetical protein
VTASQADPSQETSKPELSKIEIKLRRKLQLIVGQLSEGKEGLIQE